MYVLVLSSMEALPKYDVLNKQNQFTYEHYNIEKYRDFTDFVSRTKAIYSFESVIVDISDVSFSSSDIVKGISLFKEFFSARVTFVLDIESEIHNVLVGCGVYSLVDFRSNTFENDLRQSLLNDEMVFKEAISKKNNYIIDNVISFIKPKINISKEFPVKIGIAGAYARAGVTTVAISMVNYLKYAELDVCYVDCKNEHISKFTKLYEHIDNDDGHVVINGISMTTSINNKWSINIVDCSTDTSQLNDCDVKILCSTSKLWELPQTAKAYQQLSDVHMLFNLSTGADEDKIKTIWQEDVEFFPYCTNLWECENSGFFNGFIKPILEEL